MVRRFYIWNALVIALNYFHTYSRLRKFSAALYSSHQPQKSTIHYLHAFMCYLSPSQIQAHPSPWHVHLIVYLQIFVIVVLPQVIHFWPTFTPRWHNSDSKRFVSQHVELHVSKHLFGMVKRVFTFTVTKTHLVILSPLSIPGRAFPVTSLWVLAAALQEVSFLDLIPFYLS